MKKIEIDNKEYEIECNAFTYVRYKNVFKNGIFEDIRVVQTFMLMQTINYQKIKQENPNIAEAEIENRLGQLMLSTLDDFVSSITKLAWILIDSANNEIEEYEIWLKGIKKFSINDKWIAEVAKFVAECF